MHVNIRMIGGETLSLSGKKLRVVRKASLKRSHLNKDLNEVRRPTMRKSMEEYSRQAKPLQLTSSSPFSEEKIKTQRS